MRSFRLALIALFIVAGALGCAEADPWVGEWKSVPTEEEEAELINPKDWVEVLLVLERNKGGELVGSIDIPDYEVLNNDGSMPPRVKYEEDGTISLVGTTVERQIAVFDEVTELSNVIKLRYLTPPEVEGSQNGEWITLTLTRPDGNTLVGLEYVSINGFKLPMRYERVP